MDCDEIRQKITSFIESGVKVSDFTRKLRVSNPSYYRFMGQSGPDKGRGSEVYSEAQRFFLIDESDGEDEDIRLSFHVPVHQTKRPRVPSPPSPGSSMYSDFEPIHPALPRGSISHSFSSATTAPPTATNPLFTPVPDITGITLDNELSDSFYSPLNCDQIRTLINQYFESTKETQAAFLRTLMAQYHTEDKKIQSVQLQRFRGMRGETAGGTNPVFYAAGVFFEKVRRGKERERDRKEKGEV